MARPALEQGHIEGLKEAQAALRKMAGTPEDQKRLNRTVVDQVIVPKAKTEVPVASGRLKSTIHSDATTTQGILVAGSATSVRYAGVIHFGWASRGLGAGVGRAKVRRAATSARSSSTGRSLSKRSVNKALKKNVRGGPIRPNPFLYRAIDARQAQVFRAYERQLEQRAQIEGLL